MLMRKFLLFAAAAILFGVMPIQAQGQAENFIVPPKMLVQNDC